MKDVSWKQAFKVGLFESVVGAFAVATLIMAIMLFPINALIDKIGGSDSFAFTLIIIIGAITFIIIFFISINETHYYLMHPDERKESNTRYRSYGNYTDFSDSGFDDGGYSDCGDGGGDGGC